MPYISVAHNSNRPNELCLYIQTYQMCHLKQFVYCECQRQRRQRKGDQNKFVKLHETKQFVEALIRQLYGRITRKFKIEHNNLQCSLLAADCEWGTCELCTLSHTHTRYTHCVFVSSYLRIRCTVCVTKRTMRWCSLCIVERNECALYIWLLLLRGRLTAETHTPTTVFISIFLSLITQFSIEIWAWNDTAAHNSVQFKRVMGMGMGNMAFHWTNFVLRSS